MPKVDDTYLQDKREQILDAAFRVCVRKPVYAITMRDIINETGWSQGAIYRYFKNAHDIMFELINRLTAGLYIKEEVDRILALRVSPEAIVHQILDVVTQTLLLNISSFGKLLFEYTALLAHQPEYLEVFNQKVRLAIEVQYLQKRILEYIMSQIESGYFKPLIPVPDIFDLTGSTIDGIQRNLILAQFCKESAHSSHIIHDLDPRKLMDALSRSTIYLLGGNPEVRFEEEPILV